MPQCFIPTLGVVVLVSSAAAASVYEGEDYLYVSPDAAEFPENCQIGRTGSGSNFGAGPTLKDLASAQVAAEKLSEKITEKGLEWLAPVPEVAFIYEALTTLEEVWDSFRYVHTEGPDHVLQGVDTRFKSNILDPQRYVRFYTSESGYVGRDKSNWDANAYRRLTFENEWGAGMVWTESAGRCSAKSVWVQKDPEIQATYDEGLVTLRYYVDPFSRAALDDRPAVVTLRQQSGLQYTLMVPTYDAAGERVSGPGLYAELEREDDGRYVATLRFTHPHSQLPSESEVSVELDDGEFIASASYPYKKFKPLIESGGCTWYPESSAGPQAAAHGYYVHSPVGACKYHVMIVDNGVVSYN